MRKHPHEQALQVLVVLAVAICICPCAGGVASRRARRTPSRADSRGPSNAVWRIGTFNQSPSEFNTGKQGPPLFGSRYPAGELVYVVGRSRPETDWPAYQEGAEIERPGSRPHPYTIQFNLPGNTQRRLHAQSGAVVGDGARGAIGSGNQRAHGSLLPAPHAQLHGGRSGNGRQPDRRCRYDHLRSPRAVFAEGDQQAHLNGQRRALHQRRRTPLRHYLRCLGA